MALLNGIHSNIKINIEVEGKEELPFSDVMVYRKKDDSFGHRVYRKPTCTNVCLNNVSHHHHTHKRAMLSTIVQRACTMADPQKLHSEFRHLREVFHPNSYSQRDIVWALKRCVGRKKLAEGWKRKKGRLCLFLSMEHCQQRKYT